MAERPNTGGGFLPNGDLWLSHRIDATRILVRVFGFHPWLKMKVMKDSYVEECHPCCGVPLRVGHAHACREAARRPAPSRGRIETPET